METLQPGFTYLVKELDTDEILEWKFLKESKLCYCFEVEEHPKKLKYWYLKEGFFEEFCIIEKLKND